MSARAVIAAAFRVTMAPRRLFWLKTRSNNEQHMKAVIVGCVRELAGLSWPEMQIELRDKDGGHSSRVADYKQWSALDWRERFAWLTLVDSVASRVCK